MTVDTSRAHRNTQEPICGYLSCTEIGGFGFQRPGGEVVYRCYGHWKAYRDGVETRPAAEVRPPIPAPPVRPKSKSKTSTSPAGDLFGGAL